MTPAIRTRLPLFLAIAALLGFLLYGHYRLVRVAFESEPLCVSHGRLGLEDGDLPKAAKSACRMPTHAPSEGSAR